MQTFQFAEYVDGVASGTRSEVEAPSLVAALIQLAGSPMEYTDGRGLVPAVVNYVTHTVNFDGVAYRLIRIPCDSWTCELPHEILRTGPIFAPFHTVQS